MFDLGLSKETSKALRIVGIILFLGMLGKFVLVVALFGAAPTVSEKLHHPSPPIVRGNFPLQEKWSFSSSDNIVATPTIAGDSVVIATSTLIYKLDLETAHIVWQTQVSGSISNPLKVFDNFVVAGGSSLRVLDLQTGQVLWERFDSEWSDVRPLSYSKGMLFVQYAHFEMFAYDISTGEILWGKKFSRNRIDIFPDGDFVYILSNHELAKYDIKTGEPVCQVPNLYTNEK